MPFNPFKYRVPPHFDIRKLSAKFETVKQMKAERYLRIAALERAGGSRCLSLADTLKRCKKGRRCLNPACPICTRRYRIWLVSRILQMLEGEIDLIMVTLIEGDDAVSPGSLHSFCPMKAINKFRQQLRRSGIRGLVIGGVDGEFDKDRRLYQPHFHLICLASHAAEIQQLSARHYPGGGAVYHGYMVKPIARNLADTIAYTSKGYWPKKTRYKGNRKRSCKRLDPNLHIEWLLWRSRFSLMEFSVLYGLRRYGGELFVINKSWLKEKEL
jgi:hypothetical protein